MGKTAIFITIRRDSSRLPEKALKPILGRSVMELDIRRAKLAKQFDSIIVCTTERAIDDEIEEVARQNGAEVFRGSVEDKLERWNGAAQKFGINYIVTFDGDDLFTEPELLDLGAEQIKTRGLDFIEAPKGIIPGAFTYAFTAGALKRVCEVKNTDDTEMMWTYFTDSGLFHTGVLKDVDKAYFADNIRCTLDYPEDYDFFVKVFEHFGCKDNNVSLKDIVVYLKEHPEVAEINMFRHKEFLENQKNHTHLVLKEAK